ncbi:helix-turn-helix transcriptional regulator [Phenylobacterium kunshanense]|uniref:MarR family transcriptional regulator n=1 Tax=Phenylobacterium kunshanense TaxID=1445034 RepID=A0A328B9E9_9CAUL|nr:metalloregulator ArsR/SmtB family transcription factor [Phenylobacterium kunshanense]RAK63597.1 MarR family transcriptional regulator [Phenylobacterium kunshanense]
MRAPADRILFHLKSRGPSETLTLAGELGISRQAALQHLERLAAEGLVTHQDERRGVGRPRRLWSLTDKAQGRFPDAHAQLTVEMLDALRAEFGEAGVERLISRREAATARAYAETMAHQNTLQDRVAALAEIRTAEGYMADWSPDPGGGFLLVENHCPICAAAAACQGFCRAEQAVFEAVLGTGVRIERTDHILAGARRCAYRITASP